MVINDLDSDRHPQIKAYTNRERGKINHGHMAQYKLDKDKKYCTPYLRNIVFMEVIHLNGFVYKSFYRFNSCFVVVFKRKRIVSNRVIRPSQSQITSTGVQQLVKEMRN